MNNRQTKDFKVWSNKITTYNIHQDAQIRNLRIILDALFSYASSSLWWKL